MASALYLVLMNTVLDKDKWELKRTNQIWFGIQGQLQSNWSAFSEVRFPSFHLRDGQSEGLYSCSTIFRGVVKGIFWVIIPPPTSPPPRLQVDCNVPHTSGVIGIVFPGPSSLPSVGTSAVVCLMPRNSDTTRTLCFALKSYPR